MTARDLQHEIESLPRAWRELVTLASNFDAAGPEIVLAAHAAGLNAAEFSGLAMVGPASAQYLALTFGAWNAEHDWHTVTPGGVFRCTPEPAMGRFLKASETRGRG